MILILFSVFDHFVSDLLFFYAIPIKFFPSVHTDTHTHMHRLNMDGVCVCVRRVKCNQCRCWLKIGRSSMNLITRAPGPSPAAK